MVKGYKLGKVSVIFYIFRLKKVDHEKRYIQHNISKKDDYISKTMKTNDNEKTRPEKKGLNKKRNKTLHQALV